MLETFIYNSFIEVLPQKLVPAVTNASFSTSNSVNAADLRTTVAEKIPAAQEEVKAFRKSHGGAKIGEITVDSLYGGMRMKGLVTETSVLDPEEGIRSLLPLFSSS